MFRNTEGFHVMRLTNLVHPLEVVAHGRVRVTRIVTSLHCAVIHGALVVNIRVLLQVTLVLKPIGWFKKSGICYLYIRLTFFF